MINSNAYNYINVLTKAADASWTRNEIITNNLANVDTPGYKRKDVSFQNYLLQELTSGDSTSLRTRVNDVEVENLNATVYTDFSELSYRLDGNNVDIDTENAVLPIYSKKNALAGYENTQQYYNTLQTFQAYDLLSDEAYTHALLQKSLSHELEGQQFFYLQEVFSPSGGSQLQFPILMAEYPFRCKEDIENYLEKNGFDSKNWKQSST